MFRHADVVFAVHPVAVLNAAFCMTLRRPYGRGRLCMTALYELNDYSDKCVYAYCVWVYGVVYCV